jgi:hypothetical protein
LIIWAFAEAVVHYLRFYALVFALILLVASIALRVSSSPDDFRAEANNAYNEIDTVSTHAPTSVLTPTPPPTTVFSVEYRAGQYKVGVDIASAEYVAIATNGAGYVCVSADSNQENITFNEMFKTNTIFTVYDGEYLDLSRCVAVLADEFYATYTVSTDKEGIMLKVGYDIDPGEYKLEAANGSGYYCIYNDSRHQEIVANDMFETTSYVTVQNGQYLVLSRCRIIN